MGKIANWTKVMEKDVDDLINDHGEVYKWKHDVLDWYVSVSRYTDGTYEAAHGPVDDSRDHGPFSLKDSLEEAHEEAVTWMRNHYIPVAHFKEYLEDKTSVFWNEVKRPRYDGDIPRSALKDALREAIDITEKARNKSYVYVGRFTGRHTSGNARGRRGTTGRKMTFDAERFIVVDGHILRQRGTWVDSDPARGPRFEAETQDFVDLEEVDTGAEN